MDGQKSNKNIPFSSITINTKVKVRLVSNESIYRCNKKIKSLLDANVLEKNSQKENFAN